LQVLCFTGLVLGVLPAAILERTGGSFLTLFTLPTWQLCLAVDLALIPLALGLCAVEDLASRGGGTPMPNDPPVRLVMSGPYAYLANPMQVSTILLLAGLGALLGSWQVASAAIMALVFAAGFANWHERTTLQARHGAIYTTWRNHVRSWWPRWRPWMPLDGRLYYAEGCGPCEALARWFSARAPIGLRLVAAQDHPTRDLDRLTYAPGDGGPEAQGLIAFARALEHLQFAWALFGFVLRLPLLRTVIQILVDLSGGGPRLVPRRAAVPQQEPPNSDSD
jgi:protein-S-isoprenylcysteine O-methyltransferase Ste14